MNSEEKWFYRQIRKRKKDAVKMLKRLILLNKETDKILGDV